MAHKKAGSTKANQGSNVKGKRLGVKIFGGQEVYPGCIIVRQRGSKFKVGENVGIGRDYTIFSKIRGIVEFKRKKGKKVISVKPLS